MNSMRKMIIILVFLVISLSKYSVYSIHFRGGAISWRPTTNKTSVLNTYRTIIIEQQYAWSRNAAESSCTTATILSFGLIGEATVSRITCLSSALTCANASYPSNVSTYVSCTDYNSILGMSYGYSSTTVNLTVLSSGLVLGYVDSNGTWLSLQLGGGGGWSMITYINMQPRSDNQLINSSPTSDIPPVNYVPAGTNLTTSINISMNDADGDNIECRFALSMNTLGGITVDECDSVCQPQALPSSTQLISNNNTCTLIVSLPSTGYYAVTIQLEDFMENSTTALSSVPLHFLLLAYDTSNPTTTCTIAPIIKSIPPNYPSPGHTITVQVTVLYIAMVIAETGCTNDTETIITNFITSSPPGMLKSNLPYALTSPQYAINLTWTPTNAQRGQTFTFCAIAIDSNYYSSSQYCFNLFVGPKTIQIATTTTTTTTTTTVITTQYNYIPLIIGLSIGLGLPLLLLLSLLSLFYLCRWCPRSLRSIIRHRFGPFDNPQDPSRSQILDDARIYRQQYINDHNMDLPNQVRTSIISHSAMNLIPMENISNVAAPLSLPQLPRRESSSILVRAYSRQIHPK